jgi:hypothetical protein
MVEYPPGTHSLISMIRASGDQFLYTYVTPVAVAVVMFPPPLWQVLLPSLVRRLRILLSLMHLVLVLQPLQRLVPQTVKENLGLGPNLVDNAATVDSRSTIRHGRLNGVQYRTQTRAIQTWGRIEIGMMWL